MESKMEGETRPWGRYEILSDAQDCKVKRITVKPEQRLSYQYHHKRSEHWVVVSGIAHVVLDDVDIELGEDDSIYIPVGAKHRIKNNSKTEDLVFIEVQCGTYFGEDDIVRITDDYSRE